MIANPDLSGSEPASPARPSPALPPSGSNLDFNTLPALANSSVNSGQSPTQFQGSSPVPSSSLTGNRPHSPPLRPYSPSKTLPPPPDEDDDEPLFSTPQLEKEWQVVDPSTLAHSPATTDYPLHAVQQGPTDTSPNLTIPRDKSQRLSGEHSSISRISRSSLYANPPTPHIPVHHMRAEYSPPDLPHYQPQPQSHPETHAERPSLPEKEGSGSSDLRKQKNEEVDASHLRPRGEPSPEEHRSSRHRGSMREEKPLVPVPSSSKRKEVPAVDDYSRSSRHLSILVKDEHASAARSVEDPHRESSRPKSTVKDDSYDSRASSRKDKSRQSTTETFKLIRTPSESHHKPPSDAIIVGEEQWRVIEAPSKPNKLTKEKDRGKDREKERDREREKRQSKEESSRRRESRRHDSDGRNGDRERERDRERDRDLDRDRHHHHKEERHRSSRHKREENSNSTDSSARLGRPRSERERERERDRERRHTTSPSSYEVASEKERDRDHDRDRDREHRDSDKRRRDKRSSHHDSTRVTQTRAHAENPRSSTASQTIVETRHGDRYSREDERQTRTRRTSTNQRPVSDVPNAADFSSLSAREAWQAERMWKGKSVYDAENGGATIPPGLASSYYDAVRQHEINAAAAAAANAMHANGVAMNPHGSSHTSYLVQSPFIAQHSGLHQQPSYYAIPVAPTVMYPLSPYSHPSPNTPPIPVTGPYDYPNTYRSYGDAVSFPVQGTDGQDQSRMNPLPEPPRQSLYSTTSTEILRQMAAAPSIADSDPSTPEYWNVYAGITPSRAYGND